MRTKKLKIPLPIKIHQYNRNSSKTFTTVTLGETDWQTSDIYLYVRPLIRRAKDVQTWLPKYSVQQIFSELYLLVFFHELHHALAGRRGTEYAADTFAWKTFKTYFGRQSVIPRRMWHKLPSDPK